MTEGKTLIGRVLSSSPVLRWHDRSEILKGARQAYLVNARRTMSHYYFPDFSPATAARRKNSGFEEDDSAWSPALLTYPVVIKLRHKVSREVSTLLRKRGFYQLPVTEENIYCGSTRQRENSGHHLFGPAGGAWWPGWRRFLLPGRRWWQDGRGYLLNLFFFFPLSSWDVIPICPAQLSLYWWD